MLNFGGGGGAWWWSLVVLVRGLVIFFGWGGDNAKERIFIVLFRSPEVGISLLFYSTYVIYVLKI